MGEIENYAWSRACQMEMMNVTQLKLGCKRNGTFIYSWEGWWEARKGREEEVLGLCWGPKAKKPAIQNTPSFKISYQCKEHYQCLLHNSTCMASPYSHIKVDVYIYIYICILWIVLLLLYIALVCEVEVFVCPENEYEEIIGIDLKLLLIVKVCW